MEENHLIRLLTSFDKTLALDYLSKVKAVTDEIKKKGCWNVAESIHDDALVDPIGFRISFKEPAFILLSHPICRLRTRVPYPKQIEWEKYLVMQLGMIPVYLVNFNVITVLKLWGEDASLVSSRAVQELLDKGELLLELSVSSKPAQYSSMNFVLKYGAELNKANGQLLEPFHKHYRYLFWASPGVGYTMSSHFLHRRVKLTSFLKVSKSLFRIASIGGYRSVYVEGQQPIPCREAYLTGFNFSQDGVEAVNNIRVMVPVDIIQDLESKSINDIFLNAMITELNSERGGINLLNNVTQIGESSYELTETVIGLVVSQLFHRSDRPAYIGTVDGLRNNTTTLLRELFKHIRLPVTLGDSLDCFELALPMLYPFVVVHEGKVYYTHPMLIGFLARQGKLDLIHPDKTQQLMALLKLVERIHDATRSMEIYLDVAMDMFRGDSKKASMSELYSIKNRLTMYKCLHRAFSESELSPRSHS